MVRVRPSLLPVPPSLTPRLSHSCGGACNTWRKGSPPPRLPRALPILRKRGRRRGSTFCGPPRVSTLPHSRGTGYARAIPSGCPSPPFPRPPPFAAFTKGGGAHIRVPSSCRAAPPCAHPPPVGAPPVRPTPSLPHNAGAHAPPSLVAHTTPSLQANGACEGGGGGRANGVRARPPHFGGTASCPTPCRCVPSHPLCAPFAYLPPCLRAHHSPRVHSKNKQLRGNGGHKPPWPRGSHLRAPPPTSWSRLTPPSWPAYPRAVEGCTPPLAQSGTHPLWLWLRKPGEDVPGGWPACRGRDSGMDRERHVQTGGRRHRVCFPLLFACRGGEGNPGPRAQPGSVLSSLQYVNRDGMGRGVPPAPVCAHGRHVQPRKWSPPILGLHTCGGAREWGGYVSRPGIPL